jgi:RimJ/RimL family protein N-acetyltransferase
VLKAEVAGDLVGFFIVEHRPDQSVYWHLTAIAPRWQGKGIGTSLWRTMLLRHRAEGATSVETTISAHNAPAMNLYARLGFSFASAQMTFHRLRDTSVSPA